MPHPYPNIFLSPPAGDPPVRSPVTPVTVGYSPFCISREMCPGPSGVSNVVPLARALPLPCLQICQGCCLMEHAPPKMRSLENCTSQHMSPTKEGPSVFDVVRDGRQIGDALVGSIEDFCQLNLEPSRHDIVRHHSHNFWVRVVHPW